MSLIDTFFLVLFLASIPLIVRGFSMNMSLPKSTPPSNRIFVSGLRPATQVDELRNAFAEFGSIASIEIVNFSNKKRKREQFAFIAFESEAVAREVVSKHADDASKVLTATALTTCGTSGDSDSLPNDNPPLYTIVKPANPLGPRYSKRVRKSMDEQEQILALVQRKDAPNMVLQVHSSHLDRMIQYIADLEKEKSAHPTNVPEYIGSSSSKSRNISLVFLRILSSAGEGNVDESRNYWHRHFVGNPVIARFGLNKLYAVDRLVRVSPEQQDNDKRANLLVNTALDILDNNSKDYDDHVILKAQAFPPKQDNLQQHIVAALERQIGEIESSPEPDPEPKYPNLQKVHLTMATTDYTHLFSSVQVFNPRTCEKNTNSTEKCTVDELFMVGVPFMPYTIELESEKVENSDENDEICRAYLKLKEVMDNYRRDEPAELLSLNGKHAFDCGSSPGGWTKYLLQDEGCQTVFSCDPGALHESVEAMQGTRYLKMRGTDAIDLLREEGCTNVSLWVSDMCLVDPKQQVDHLVEAKEKGILAANAFFVLTLKFNTGHSKETFDRFACQELERLKELVKVESVQTYHLFSNRKGERTIMGRLV